MTCFTWPVRIYYEDTDHGGVVYYANYLKFMERCRTELLRSKNIEQHELIVSHELMFAVKRMDIEYKKPARLDDLLLVTATMSDASRVQIRFKQRIFRLHSHDELLNHQWLDEATLSSGEELSSADFSIVSVDSETLKVKRIPVSIFKELMG